MSSDIITYLLYALIVAWLFQPTMARRAAVGLFVFFTIMHELYLSEVDGLLYYGSAAFFDLLIILLTRNIRPLTDTIVNIHMICVISILFNYIGWIIWALYLPPLIYNWSFVMVYSLAVYAFLRMDDSNVGGGTMGVRDSYIFGLFGKRFGLIHKHQGGT